MTPADNQPPNGESFAQLCLRVAAAVPEVAAAYPGKHVVIAAHGGTIRAENRLDRAGQVVGACFVVRLPGE